MKGLIHGILLFGIICLPVAFAENADAFTIVERMAKAARELNYDASFVYSRGSQIDEMRIIHRSSLLGEQERLISLSGVQREVLRNDKKVTYILPDTQAVVVGKSRPQIRYNSSVLSAEGDYARFYRLITGQPSRVAGRSVYSVHIKPKDKYRFGYDLWADQRTGLLLRSHLINQAGSVLERISYTNVSFPDMIYDEMLEPESQGAQFVWYISEERPSKKMGPIGWLIQWLPPGFRVRDSQIESLPTGRMPVYHTVYSDGLASLSVYIEELQNLDERLEGAAHMGAMNAFGRVIDDYQITVVGEVPLVTVTKVAQSIIYDP